MKLHNLKPAKGAVKKDTRLGRGEGTGKGGTATRGHKGAQSRSGYKRHHGFEGGQMPLQRRTPKRGFKNFNRKEYRVLNLADLQYLADEHGLSKIDVETLRNMRFVSRKDMVKILGNGELKAKLEVTAHAFSKTAKDAIESNGGTVNTVQ